VSHTTYGLLMEHGRWCASCGCGWRSAPTPDLAESTDALDGHLRGVVTAEQRPGRVGRVASASVVTAVDHTAVLGALALGLALLGPLGRLGARAVVGGA